MKTSRDHGMPRDAQVLRIGPPWLHVERLSDGWRAHWRGRVVVRHRRDCPTEGDFRAIVLQAMFGDGDPPGRAASRQPRRRSAR